MKRLAFVLLCALALAAPLSLGASTTVSGLIMATALVIAVRERPDLSELLPVTAALVLFVAVMALAAIASPGMPPKWKTVENETWIKLLLLAVPVLAASVGAGRARVLDIFIGMSAVVAIFGIVQHFTGIDPFREGKTNRYGDAYQVAGFFGHHLTYGGHVLVAWVLATARLLSGSLRSRRGRIAGVLAVVLLSIALLWSHARSAQLGAGAGLVVLAVLGTKRTRLVAAVMAAVVVLAGLAMPTVRERVQQSLDVRNEETRLNLWASSWDAIQERPLLGYGPGRFQEMMAVHEVEGFYDSKAHAHNDYLMHGVNAGLLGLASAMLLLLAIGSTLARARSLVTEERWILDAALAALLGMMVAGMFQVYWTDDEVEVSWFLLLGCALGVAIEALRAGLVAPRAEAD